MTNIMEDFNLIFNICNQNVKPFTTYPFNNIKTCTRLELVTFVSVAQYSYH